jgi:hypothetical protein
MDWAEFEHRRVSGFRTVRNRYDKDEVDRFLEDVADWLQTDAAAQLGDELVQRKLEQVGQATARILLIAEQETEELRRTAEQECAQLRAQAQAEADASTVSILAEAEQRAEELRQRAEEECERARAEADTAANDTCSRAEQYATRIRAQADADAEQMLADAAKQAQIAVIEETERQRAEMDPVVAELDRRRNVAVDAVERLRADLLSAIAEHSTRPAGAEGEGDMAGRRHSPTYGPSRHANA